MFETGAVKMVASDLKEIVNDARLSLTQISQAGTAEFTQSNCGTYLDKEKKAYPFFTLLLVVDRDGNVVCQSQGIEQPGNISFFPVFQATIKSGEFVVTDIHNNDPETVTELQMGIPFREETGTIQGILIGFFDVNNFSPAWENSRLPESAQIYVLNQKGFIINESIKNSRDQKIISTEFAKNMIAKSSIENISFKFTGSDHINRTFQIEPIDPKHHYFISVGFPEGKLIANARDFIGGNVMIITLLTLAVLIITYTGLENSVIRPLRIVSQTAETLAKGDLSARTNLPHQKDEIGKFGEIFDNMAVSLEKSQLFLEEETSAKLAVQEKFLRLFEDSVLGIFQLNPDFRLREVNPALVKMFGYSSETEMIDEVAGMVGRLFLKAADNEKISQLIEQRQVVRMETQFRRRDGTVFDGNLHMWGVWNAQGEFEAAEGFVEDTTDSRKNQRQLFKLSQAVEQNPIGIVISDGKGNIEYANPGIGMIFGYEPEELIGNSLLTLGNNTVDPNEIDAMRKALLENRISRGEVKNSRKNGESFWERYVISPINNIDGDSINTLCLIEDITEQNLNKERIAQQFEELSALRTIDLAISSNLDLVATLNIIANLAVKYLNVDGVCIYLYDSRYYMLHPVVHQGLSGDLPENIPFPAAADLSDWELVEEFSIHIRENLAQQKKNHRVPFPADKKFDASFGLPLVAKADVKGLFQVFLKKSFTPGQHWLDFFYNLATQTAVAIDNFELFNNLRQSNSNLLQAYEATIEGWSKALSYRDQETEDHSQRTTNWTIDLAREMGYPTEELIHIRRGALLHDIGKMAIPDSILNKPGPLTEEEWVLMRKHPEVAHNVLAPIQFLEKSLDIPYCHHEHWDGKGYPRGLKGREIPLAARIFSVIDVYDALTSDRPYRSAWSEEKVIQYLCDQSGSQFDPAVVNAFLALLKKQSYR